MLMLMMMPLMMMLVVDGQALGTVGTLGSSIRSLPHWLPVVISRYSGFSATFSSAKRQFLGNSWATLDYTAFQFFTPKLEPRSK
jgi:hypothetical protein